MQLDHAGIVTDDADALAEGYAELLAGEIAHEESYDGMRMVFLDVGNTYFELIEPREEGTVMDYLENNGPGIHHLAVETDDIEVALRHARDLGVELIDEEPRPGAWGHDIAFLHPASTGGILLEFVEH